MAQYAETQLLSAWKAGRLCLHPTDTLPGLSFNPLDDRGYSALCHLKQRPHDKPLIGLIADLAAAAPWWSPLTPKESRFLAELWPGPVSVVRQASGQAPASMVSASNELALRCPVWSDDLCWMNDLLVRLALPFPTTSVNISDQPPARNWSEAAKFAQMYDVFVPGIADPGGADNVPSTVIRLTSSDQEPLVLRHGRVSREAILNIWREL